MKHARVLVVDDSRTMRQYIAFSLQRIPVLTVDQAGDGAEALQLLTDSSYDLVLCDVNMPVMNGLELLERMRCSKTNCSVPIVMITTEGADSVKRHALALGANDFLTKPLQTTRLVDVALKLLNR